MEPLILAHRDVYWCWIVNDPFFLSFSPDKPQCELCNWVDTDSEDGVKPSKVFRTQHTYVTHVFKPKFPDEDRL